MYKRITFLMSFLCLAVFLSAAESVQSNAAQATDAEKTKAAQATGTKKTKAAQATGTKKMKAVQTAGTEKPEAVQAANTEKPEAEQAADTEKSNVVQAKGKVRLVGSGPMPELVISGEGKQWYVAKEDMQKLNALQHRIVTLEGEETIRELRWANGRSAGKRRYLRNVKILNVE